MFFKRILPISVIFLASIIGFWKYQNPCLELVDYTYQNGWQGEDPFSVKIERIPESRGFGSVVAGANYIFSGRQADTENWRQIMTVHNDDPVDIPKDNVKIVNEKLAYTFMNGKYAVTHDNGKNWTVWSVNKIPNWNFQDYGYIQDAIVSESGVGLLKLEPLNKNKNVPTFYTSDFGKSWKQIN